MKFNALRHPFFALGVALEKAIAPAPLDRKIANDMLLAQEKVMQFDYTIRLQQFGKHMALAEIQALSAWAEMERAKETTLGEQFP